jgi:AbiV family abortive infection protein
MLDRVGKVNPVMDLTPSVLLKGAWYSLEQCGLLLSDAVFLYRDKRHSIALALAMIGREELGKHRAFIEEWEKAETTGKYPTVDDIQALCLDHADKQRQAMLSVAIRTEGPSSLGAAMRTLTRHKPGDPEYQQARELIEAATKALAKRLPNDRHDARMRALYVDLEDSGSDWSRPSEQPHEEVRRALEDLANDYVGQTVRVDPDALAERSDGKLLAAALEAWDERPALPAPVWPN